MSEFAAHAAVLSCQRDPVMPRVSVIIPCYNYAHYLAEAIDSALAQSHSDVEIVVLDDGSTDDTAAVAARYGASVRYVRQDNRGLPAARNAGVAASTGPLLAFLDADDVWLPDKLAKQLDELTHTPVPGLISGAMEACDAAGRPLGIRKPALEPGRTYPEIVIRGTAPPSTFLVPRTIFERVGGFDETMPTMEDLDLCLRIAKQHQIRHVTDVVGLYRDHGAGLSTRPDKVYPGYISIYTRLLDERATGVPLGLVRRRLSSFHYLLGRHQVRTGDADAGCDSLGRALATWPLVGWELAHEQPVTRRTAAIVKAFASYVTARLWPDRAREFLSHDHPQETGAGDVDHR